VTGGLLFDVCQTLGGMGENGGRYFLSQMLDVLEYMHGKGVVHRDLKLENILVDDNMNLKVADFGFATFRKIHNLSSYRGTMTYMAPEIKEGKKYDGIQIDMFSTAVILFIIVQGIFPFKEAKKDEYFYKLILEGDLETYWKKTGGQTLSKEFKDLIIKMFSHNGAERPTIEQIRAHPWMTASFDIKEIRNDILSELAEKRSQDTQVSSREDCDSRGDNMLNFVKHTSVLDIKKFNDMNDFDIKVEPGVVWDDINTFNTECFDEQFIVEKVKDKHIMLTLKGTEEGDQDLVVKVKFFQVPDQDDESKIRVRFVRKTGEIDKWYSILKEMKTSVMKDILMTPEQPDLITA
jgi:serine/threonine protein kinase